MASTASTVEPEPAATAGAGASSRHVTQVTIGGAGAGDVTDDEKRDSIRWVLTLATPPLPDPKADSQVKSNLTRVFFKLQ